MYVLDLINDQNSQISYERVRFPDGQVSLKIDNKTLTPAIIEHAEVTIQSRFDNYQDLFYILSARDILWYNGIEKVNLFITCMLTQRSDRRFDGTTSFDLKIIASILKGFDQIEVFHPHSDTMANLFDTLGTKFQSLDNKWIVRKALTDIEAKEKTTCILVSPDAGAFKWIKKLGDDVARPIVTANKHRDLTTGELTIVLSTSVKDEVCLIVDDYIDGGRTFMLLASRLKELGARAVYLVTSHGLFSAGVEFLMKDIEHIYTSNSIATNMEVKLDAIEKNWLTIFKIV